jgi:hypothetical protein
MTTDLPILETRGRKGQEDVRKQVWNKERRGRELMRGGR